MEGEIGGAGGGNWCGVSIKLAQNPIPSAEDERWVGERADLSWIDTLANENESVELHISTQLGPDG